MIKIGSNHLLYNPLLDQVSESKGKRSSDNYVHLREQNEYSILSQWYHKTKYDQPPDLLCVSIRTLYYTFHEKKLLNKNSKNTCSKSSADNGMCNFP